jgi:hypothetical protein
MADKTLQEWRKYYKKNFPTWPDEEVEVRAKFSFQAQEWENAGSPSGNPLDPKTWNKTGTTGTSSGNPVVGRKPAPKPASAPLGTGTVLAPTSAAGVPSGLSGAINTGLGNVGVEPVEGKEVDTINFVTELTNAEVKQIIPYLKKFGATKTNLSTYSNAKDFLQTNFPTLVENAKGSVKNLIQLFKDESTGYGTGGEDTIKSSGVTQYVTEKSPALLKQNVDKFLLETIGSTNIKEESRNAIMNEIEKLIKEGTTTTTKRDKSGKDTVVQTAGYSDERAGAVVERIAKELEPEKYQQQRELTFFDFMQQAEQMRGGR